MSSSTLHVAGLFVVSSDDVPLTTEYALFDAGDIELRASGPGTVREMGYHTTAKSARERLEAQGIDARLVSSVEDALRSQVAAAFARGEAVRALVPYMSAGELLDGGTWLAEDQMYQGTSLYLSDLARDCGVAQASLAFQAIALASLLGDVPDDAPVVLSTLDYTRDRRPGERTHRRVSLEHAAEIASALQRIGLPGTATHPADVGPSKNDLLESLRKRAEVVTSQGGKDRMIRFERALAERQMPAKGPLSDSAAWRLEVQLAKGQTEGISDTLDALERMRGRSPTTAYLRARAQLVSGEVDPRVIAEKVSALGMSINSAFPELDLLIAESWAAAGEAKRALPYARDLVANPTLHTELRARAEAIVNHPEAHVRASQSHVAAAAVAGAGAEPRTVTASLPLASKPSSRPPRTTSEPPIKQRVPTSIPPMGVAPPSLHPGMMPPQSIPHSLPLPTTTRGSSAYNAVRSAEEMPDLEDLPREGSLPPTARTPAPPPPAKRTPIPTLRPQSHAQSMPTRPPSRGAMPEATLASLEQQDRGGSPLDLVDSRHVSSRPGAHSSANANANAMPMRPSSEYHAVRASPSQRPSQLPPPSQRDRRVSYPPPPDPRAEPGNVTPHFTAAQEITHDDIVELSIQPASSSRMPSHRPSRTDVQATKPPPVPPPGVQPRRASDPSLRTEFMRGASQPSFKAHQALAPTPPTLAPMFPRSDPQTLELASSLELPYGLSDQRWSGGGAPRSVLEARLHFVHLSRQLGNMYKQQLGVELTADVAGIEAMQRHLLERFSSHVLQNAEDAEDARRHGAFLSEILIRRLNAEWVDIASTDLGYWGMLLGNDTRVWPFGRVLRYISLGHKERDLVSYFLELQTRIRT